jgi:signal transduction histidine kinase
MATSMKNPIKRFLNTYFDPNLGLRVQAFNLLAFAGMSAGLITALTALLSNAGPANLTLNLAGALAGFLCLCFARRTNRYRAGFLITVVVVFIGIFPFMFFSGGGYRSGMPPFFIFAVVFTAVMLEGKVRAAFIALEFALYAVCFLVAYRFPHTVRHFATERDFMLDAFTGTVVAGLILVVVTLLYIRIYDSRQKRLDELDRLKTEFLQNVSHELKTPLTVMINCAIDTLRELERETPDPAEMAFDQGRIRAEGERLKRMVSQLLDVTAIESGMLRIQKAPLSLAVPIYRAVEASSGVLNENEIRLTLEIPNDLPDVAADADAVEQVLLNLLSNAARHAKGGAIAVRLSAETACRTVRVSDDGEGMTKAVSDRVFLRYIERESGTTGRSGMGLFICKKLIDAHGGKIGIESEPGRGTTVWFTLPAEEMGGERT